MSLELKTGKLRSTEAAAANNKVILREQVSQVLRMLLEHEGKIVTREEIKERLWAKYTAVDFGHSVNATINTLRRALGDSADGPRYIETLARRGYRLMPPIESRESAPGTDLGNDRERREQSAAEISKKTSADQHQKGPHRWKTAQVLAFAVILAGSGYIS